MPSPWLSPRTVTLDFQSLSKIMAYKSNFDEDPEIELRFLVEVVGQDRDEVDARSRFVINLATGSPLPKYVLHKGFFPQRQTPLEFRAERENTGRLKKISEKKLQTLKVGRSHSGILSLITTEQPLDESEQERLSNFLKNACSTGHYRLLYCQNNLVLVSVDSKETFTMVGEKILHDCGLNIVPNKRVMSLEALDSVPNYFLELSTSRASGEEIQRKLSEALYTFCSVFNYLCLRTNDEEMAADNVAEQRPCFPAVSLTLMFVKMAQDNARALETILSSDQSSWRTCQIPEVVRAPNERQFALRKYPGPLLGLKSGCPFPGVRVSVTFSRKLEEMERFYEVVTGVHPVPREDPKLGTSYRIYPITQKFELHLVYNSSVQVENLENVRIFIRIENKQNIAVALQQELSCVGAGHWETRDPVGTRVVLFTAVV